MVRLLHNTGADGGGYFKPHSHNVIGFVFICPPCPLPQVAVSNYEIFLCFGAVVPDGYGVCYNPQENRIILSVSCYHSCPDTNSIMFLKRMAENLIEMRDMLVAARGLSAKL
jgi:hypothetical protein